jgi:hypothetical protein
MFGKRCRAKPEGINGIRNRDLKNQKHLGKERTSDRIFRKAIELEIAKRTAGYSVRIRKTSDWTLWKGRPPPKQNKNKKGTAHTVKAGYIRAPARTDRKKDLYCFHPVVCHDVEKKVDDSTPGSTGTL